MSVKLLTVMILSGLLALPLAGAALADDLPRPLERISTVVIDPGHGGIDSGALGVCGTAEAGLALKFSMELRDALQERYPALNIVLTREADVFVGLSERAHIANQAQGDVFISIHFNAAANPAAHGIETFFISPEGLGAGELVPGREADGPALARLPVGVGGDLPALLLDQLVLQGSVRESAQLAESVQQGLLANVDARDRGVRQGRFRVLRGIRMPAIVAELGFLSNEREGARLVDAEYRASLVEGLIEGLVRWDRASHVAIAEWRHPERPVDEARGLAGGAHGSRPALRAHEEPAP